MKNIKERFFKDDRLERVPKKERDKIELFKYLILKFDIGKEYNEKEINDILSSIYDDYVLLRRYLIDYKFLNRDDAAYTYRVNKERDNE